MELSRIFNFEELVRLIDEYTPTCICLQDLQLCDRDYFRPSEYQISLKSTFRGDMYRDGAGLLIHKYVSHTPMPLDTYYIIHMKVDHSLLLISCLY